MLKYIMQTLFLCCLLTIQSEELAELYPFIDVHILQKNGATISKENYYRPLPKDASKKDIMFWEIAKWGYTPKQIKAIYLLSNHQYFDLYNFITKNNLSGNKNLDDELTLRHKIFKLWDMMDDIINADSTSLNDNMKYDRFERYKKILEGFKTLPLPILPDNFFQQEFMINVSLKVGYVYVR